MRAGAAEVPVCFNSFYRRLFIARAQPTNLFLEVWVHFGVADIRVPLLAEIAPAGASQARRTDAGVVLLPNYSRMAAFG